MLTIQGSRGSSMYYAAHVELPSLDFPHELSWYYLDPLRDFLHGSYLKPEHAPLLEALGFGTTDDSITLSVTGDRPVGEKYRGAVDDWRFGHGFMPLGVPSYPAVRAEQEVFHSTYQGTAISTGSSDVNVLGSLMPAGVVRGVQLPPHYSQTRVVRTMMFDGTWSIGPRSSEHYKVISALPVLEAVSNHGEDIWAVDNYPGSPHSVITNSIIWDYHPGILSVVITGFFRLFPFGHDAWYSPSYASIPFTERLVVTLWEGPHEQFMGVHDEYVVRGLQARAHRAIEFGSLAVGHYPYSIPPSFADLANQTAESSRDLHNIVVTFSDLPGKLIALVDDGFNTSYTSRSVTASYDSFVRAMQGDYRNLLPGLFYSSSDAITKHIDIIKSNNLENLASLGSLASLIPDVGAFISALLSAKNGRLLDAGAKLIDLWSEVQLQLDFGIRPAISDVQALSDSYTELVSRFRDQGIWGEFTLNGKFVYDLPAGSLGRETPVRAVFRSKVRTTFAHTSLLATLVRGQSIGVLPSLSNLWDLVPFSFVVDWFWNIGDRISDAEAQVFMLMLPCHFCTHSITLYSDFTQTELDLLQLQPAGDPGTLPGFKLYHRLTSRRFPVLRDSLYDFRSAAGPNSLLTAGALALQLMK